MKSAVKAVVLFTLLFTLFGATLAHAQPVPGQFQHVILVIQENRTPDNLFGGVPGPSGVPPFEAGVDLKQAPDATQWCLGACFDPQPWKPRLERPIQRGAVQPPRELGYCC